jgi:hypothetical protein
MEGSIASATCRLTDDITLHQVETIEFADRLGRIVRTLIYHISRSLCLQRRVVPEPDLTDGSIASKKVVQVVSGDIEVAISSACKTQHIPIDGQILHAAHELYFKAAAEGGAYNKAREAIGSLGRCILTGQKAYQDGEVAV